MKTEDLFDVLRERMLADIEAQTENLGARLGMRALSNRVMAAVARVPRHEFVSEEIRPFAYIDQPLPIGFGKTISQPFIVALMTHLLEVEPGHRVLEVGTGCGYQAATLAELAARVFTIEIVEPLARRAEARLKSLGYANVDVRCSDGYLGWPEHAPFDAICVTADPGEIPAPLLEQLAPGGRMVIPVRDELRLVTKTVRGTLEERCIEYVRFVPLVRA